MEEEEETLGMEERRKAKTIKEEKEMIMDGQVAKPKERRCINRSENEIDLGTKSVTRQVFDYLMSKLSFKLIFENRVVGANAAMEINVPIEVLEPIIDTIHYIKMGILLIIFLLVLVFVRKKVMNLFQWFRTYVAKQLFDVGEFVMVKDKQYQRAEAQTERLTPKHTEIGTDASDMTEDEVSEHNRRARQGLWTRHVSVTGRSCTSARRPRTL